MRTYTLLPKEGFDAITLTEREPVRPGPGEVRVRMHAFSLNYRDLLVAKGSYGNQSSTNLIPLSDGAGEVIEVGEGVTEFQVGDRVAGIFFQNWEAGRMRKHHGDSALGGAIDGVLSEEKVFAQGGLVRIPDYMSYEEAATLPCAAVTVWNAMFETGTLRAGESVLLQGTGGVSLFGLQFAKAAGLQAVITSSSDEKLERARALGADLTINYRETPEWGQATRDLTGGYGVDHVIEVGGSGTFGQSLKAVTVGGTISMIGVLTGTGGQVSTGTILHKAMHVNGIYVGSRAMFEDMNRMLALHEVHPIIDQIFSFEDVRAAYEHLESGKHFGKVVIKIE